MMYNSRIQYAIDNFIDEGYFLPMKQSYELKETADSGRSLLKVTITGENICVEDYDNKKRCGFLRISKEYGMQTCIDHFLLKEAGTSWDLYMIEMKSGVGHNTWKKIKLKMRSSLLNIKALCEVLGITIGEVYACTTYETEKFSTPENTADPKALVAQLGKKAIDPKRDEWNQNIINIEVDGLIELPHKAIKMERDSNGVLQGELQI